MPSALLIRSSPQRSASIHEFKQRTLNKLSGVRCPKHRQPPRIHFQGATLQTISIRMSGCCDELIALANQKIAGN